MYKTIFCCSIYKFVMVIDMFYQLSIIICVFYLKYLLIWYMYFITQFLIDMVSNFLSLLSGNLSQTQIESTQAYYMNSQCSLK